MEVRFFNGDRECLGIVRLVDGVAVPDDRLRDMLDGMYIVEPGPVTYADGERFLQALPVNFRSAYFWAAVVDSDTDDAPDRQAASVSDWKRGSDGSADCRDRD